MPSLRGLRYSKILKQRYFNSVLPKSKLKDDKESRLTKPVSWPSSPPSAPGLVLGLSTNWLMTNIRGWPLDPTLAVTLPRAPTRHSFLRRKSLLVTGSGLCCPPHFEATRTSRLRLSFHGNLWWSFIWHHLPCGDSHPPSIFLCFLVTWLDHLWTRDTPLESIWSTALDFITAYHQRVYLVNFPHLQVSFFLLTAMTGPWENHNIGRTLIWNRLSMSIVPDCDKYTFKGQLSRCMAERVDR